MKRLTTIMIVLSSLSAIGGCCGANRCGPCGCGTQGVPGFGTYGGYGTQYGQAAPSNNAYYAPQTMIQPTMPVAQPVAACAASDGRVERRGRRVDQAAAEDPVDHGGLDAGVERETAVAAALLYQETAASTEARARLSEQLRMAPAAFVFEEKGRPSKKDRRDIERLRDARRG